MTPYRNWCCRELCGQDTPDKIKQASMKSIRSSAITWWQGYGLRLTQSILYLPHVTELCRSGRKVQNQNLCELKPEDFTESCFWIQSCLSHILPYLTLHTWFRENGVKLLLYGNWNEKDICWHAFLGMWHSKILFLRSCQQRLAEQRRARN